MTKKHYIVVAKLLKAISGLVSASEHQRVCEEFATELGKFNPLFDRERFLLACGVCPLVLQARIDAFNAGYGKIRRRAYFCKDANEWVEQEKDGNSWLCLHE